MHLEDIAIFNYSRFHVPEWLYSIDTIRRLIDFSVIIAPISSYGFTIYDILKSGSSAGFSQDICGILLFSR